MSTAKQLISAFVDAPPLYWDRSYVQNMREIRGYPNWWRIRDDESYIDGPPQNGEQYTRDLNIWKSEVVKDPLNENTNQIDLYNLSNFWEYYTQELSDGTTDFYFVYDPQPPEYSYTHTNIVDSVSLEFDQLGRKMVAFESNGDVFLIWFDSQAGTTVVTNFGSGYNPQIVTDTYRRVLGSADSTRLLFYVDQVSKQLVYRKQEDRFGVVYTLPNAPSDIVELLKVSKNLYGGLTALYCYDDGTGNLLTGSFTARDASDVVNIGTDSFNKSKGSLVAFEGSVTEFLLKAGLNSIDVSEEVYLTPATGVVSAFQLRENSIEFEADPDTASFVSVSGTVSGFELKDSIITLPASDGSSLVPNTGTVSSFSLKETLISIQNFGTESATLSATTGQVTDFLLG